MESVKLKHGSHGRMRVDQLYSWIENSADHWTQNICLKNTIEQLQVTTELNWIYFFVSVLLELVATLNKQILSVQGYENQIYSTNKNTREYVLCKKNITYIYITIKIFNKNIKICRKKKKKCTAAH